MSGDRWIRRATSAAVAAVAAFAAVVSYSHIYDLGRSHGQSGTAARLLPLSVDGLILAASLVLLHEARKRRRAPVLAQSMLGLGVAATVAANVAYGAAWGWLGAVISAWPAVAFVGAAEMMIGLVRASEPAGGRHGGGVKWAAVPADAHSAARVALEASIAASNPLSQRQLAERFGLTRAQATALARQVAADANGSGNEKGHLVT